MWHYKEYGAGRPLVLLHGIGMSNKAWNPVIPLLAARRRVIAFDVAGFGNSPQLAAPTQPTVANLVQALGQQLKAMGIDQPVDIAGNSMGGWMALEAARTGLARSVVAISPAGLWSSPPPHIKPVFFSLRRGAQLMPSITRLAMKSPVLRELLLAVPLSNGSRHMPYEDAVSAALDFANAAGFDNTFAHAGRFMDGHTIQVPVTVAFGSKDWLLTRGTSQLKDELPAHTKWLQPKDWGHVPMWKDPQGVASLILDHTY